MIDLLLYLLKEEGIHYGFFRLMNYITFRAITGMATSLVIAYLLGYRLIYLLYRHGWTDTSGEFLQVESFAKRGTPTAGGIIFISATVGSLFLWGKFSLPTTWILLGTLLYFGLVGFMDDYFKTRLKSSLAGLSRMAKTFLLLLFIIPFTVFYLSPAFPVPSTIKLSLYLPFSKSLWIPLGVGLFFIFAVFALFSVVNAVNITDGMDGLLGGTAVMVLTVYGILAYITGNRILAQHFLFPYMDGGGEVTVFSACLVGGVIGFLWFNVYPAEVFMGDTGSLALGGVMGVMMFLIKQELLFPILGGLYVWEIFTSLLQDRLGMRIGRRIFTRAPYHHLLPQRGIPEPKAVFRLWVVAIILGLIALATIKIR